MSILDEGSCRGSDARKAMAAVWAGARTISDVSVALHRGTAYTHKILRLLAAEDLLVIARERRVRDSIITAKR